MPDHAQSPSGPYRMPERPSTDAKPPYIGGQAVLEGVMMRSPTSFAVVVRRRDASLHVRERGVPDGRTGPTKLPLVRGIASLVESLKLGSEALRFSAEQMERDLDAEEADNAAKGAGKTGKGGLGASALSMLSGVLSAVGYTTFLLLTADADGQVDANGAKDVKTAGDGSLAHRASIGPDAAVVQAPNEHAPKEKEANASRGPMTLMVVLMVAFFIALPQAAAAGVNRALHLGLDVQSPGFQAITGAFKLTIVIGYLLIVRRVFPDIRRVFQYHGAEHKTISTYEAGEALTVENARAKTTLHPRCGTTFLVMVALVSILVFTAVGGMLPKIQTGKMVLDNLIFLLEKLPFLPVIAAVTFEIQRIFARYCTTGPLRALLWPGFLCQKITTIEPDDTQLEVALASLRVTLLRETGVETSTEARPGDVRYATFDALMSAPRLRRASA